VKRQQIKVDGACGDTNRQERWVYVLTHDTRDVSISFSVASGIYPGAASHMNTAPDARDLSLHIGWMTTRGEMLMGERKAGQQCSFTKRGRCYDVMSEFTTGLGAEEFFKAYWQPACGYEQPESFWLALGDKLFDWLKLVPPDIETLQQKCIHCDGLGTVRKP